MNNIFNNVVGFCHKKLLNTPKMMDYLQNRGVSLQSISQFQLGLFPTDLRELFEIADPKELRSASIIRHASASQFQIHNLIIPIKDVYGSYIAIAGRTCLSEKERKDIPKYKNSIYKKSQHLFGLNFAKHTILKTNIVYVVEGYFDVITPHQKGLTNVVATCGTFLSTRHIILLARYTNNIVLLLDNEDHAQEKARKIIEKKKRDGINLYFANPLDNTKYKDVDEFLQHHSINKMLSNLKIGEEYADIKPLWD